VCHQMDSTSVRDGPVVVLAIVAPVVSAVWLVTAMLGGVWSFFEFLFGLAVLSMSLGPADPIRQTQQYIQALQDEDAEGAKLHAGQLLGMEINEQPVVTAQRVKETLFIRVCSSILGVFFWFIVLGPLGAAMFRLSCLLQDRFAGTQSGLANSVLDFYQILMWVPARMTVLCFAIVGSFVDVTHSLKKVSDLWQRDSDELLYEAGLGALHIHDCSAEDKVDIEALVHCLSLAKRAVLAFVTVLAIFVIASWVY
jgi:membrane protein required for beta-lactamase induction